MSSQITHLHVHSQYSLLAATATVQELVNRAVDDGMTHLALTDTSALYGAVAFGRACEAAQILPITGMTIQIALPEELSLNLQNGLLVLLATGSEGYRSLCRISSSIQGTPDREASIARGVPFELLKENCSGLLCLSGGRRGWISRMVRQGHEAAAARFVSRLAMLFDERLWLSIELHTSEDQSMANELLRLGKRFGVNCVATQPVYSLLPEERHRFRLLSGIEQNSSLDAVPDGALPDQGDPSVDLHWLSPDEMRSRFALYPTALDAIQDVIQSCEPALPDGQTIWPVPKNLRGESAETTLITMAKAGLQQRFQPLNSTLISRLNYELEIINQHGYAPLFLMVAEVVSYARTQEIPFSTRGSVANSLVAYCCNITTIDPIEHALLFERFLNPERSDPPDIDLDFCSRRRDEILDYMRNTYGADKVALVATISTLRPRSALRETAKVYGLPESAIKRLIQMLPDSWHPDPRRRIHSVPAELLAKIEDDEERKVVAAAYEIVGQPHHLSIHPGGLVVTPEKLTDYVPVQWAPKGFLITQFEHGDVEAIGLPKLDLLGIRALTVLTRCTELICQHYDPNFRLSDIPAQDESTGQMIARGDTVGVFQCESTGAQRTLRQLQARSVADLAVANAFFKPGPATGGMAAAFIRRYRGEEEASYLHPSLVPILQSTYGVLLFQEQILRVAREIAGLSWAEADHIRRGMSKFRTHEMTSIRERFVSGCQRPHPHGPALSPEQANTLWEQVLAFAGYGFNQGHATAYADVSYRSAYLKQHWPAAFLTARLIEQGGFHHPAIYLAEMNQFGVSIRPPHINHSLRYFTLAFEGDAENQQTVLWLGLGQVRSLRKASVQSIIEARGDALFVSLQDLARRVLLQPKELTHLIQCGALDGLAAHRAELLDQADDIRRAKNLQQMSFGFESVDSPPEESRADRLSWEQHLLDYPVTVHPLDIVALPQANFVPLSELNKHPGQRNHVVGVRLPGWTGTGGFYLGDRRCYVRAGFSQKRKNPRPWHPLHLTGRWLLDEWGGGWFQIDTCHEL